MHLSFLLMFNESKIRRLISKLALMLASWKLLHFFVRLINPKSGQNFENGDSNTKILLQKSKNQANELDFIISAYKFEPHVQTLKRNIQELNQKSRANFVFVLSQPTKKEKLEVLQLCEQLPNASVIESSKRTTVYESWNIAIRHSSSPVISNLNVDDIRNPECIDIALEAIKDNDVVYSDFYLSKKPIGNWAGLETNSELVETGEFSLQKLVIERFNYPHAAPFWKREIHDSYGYFDERLTSSGDTEFWLRILLEGAKFKRIPKALYGYYENPSGLSTNLSSRGRLEWASILERNHKAIRDALKREV